MNRRLTVHQEKNAATDCDTAKTFAFCDLAYIFAVDRESQNAKVNRLPSCRKAAEEGREFYTTYLLDFEPEETKLWKALTALGLDRTTVSGVTLRLVRPARGPFSDRLRYTWGS